MNILSCWVFWVIVDTEYKFQKVLWHWNWIGVGLIPLNPDQTHWIYSKNDSNAPFQNLNHCSVFVFFTKYNFCSSGDIWRTLLHIEPVLLPHWRSLVWLRPFWISVLVSSRCSCRHTGRGSSGNCFPVLYTVSVQCMQVLHLCEEYNYLKFIYWWNDY